MNKSKVIKGKKQIKLSFNKKEGEFAGFNIERVVEEIGLEYEALAVSAGKLVMQAIMESEIEELAGKRYARQTAIDRWGKEERSVVVGGQKVPVEYQRLRTKQGEEVKYSSYERFQDEQERTKAIFNHLVSGLSSRSYGRVIEKVQEGYGISKSVVNRRMIEATSEQLKSLCEKDLSDLDICAVIIDGVHIAETVQIVAMGVETNGRKHILGFREGATENSQVCVELLEDIIQRGFKAELPILVVIDGSKALRAAVERIWGKRAFVQRCQIHKKRNVMEHLPQQYRPEYERKIKSAYAMNDYTRALESLKTVVGQLKRINESAARSLEEGLEETLTLHRLGLPDIVRRSFSTTNLIDSTFSQGRGIMHNVKRWRNSGQIQRWTATALLESEKRFRRVKGYRSMPVLMAALENEYMKINLEQSIKAA
jgi:transposase-like protein